MKVISYVIIATLIASVLVNAQAFATPQPYVAGYPNTTTITKHGQYTAITDFIGTPTATRENDISSVFSSATYASSTASTPTGWIHQQAVTLKPTNSIYGAHQIYKGPTCMSNCSGVNYVILGTHGTGLGGGTIIEEQ